MICNLCIIALGLFVIFGCIPVNAIAADDSYLKELLNDPSYGNLNRYITKEIGNSLAVRKLGIEIGTMNDLAKKAKLSQDKVLEMFKSAVKEGESLGLETVWALRSITDSISFRIALEEQEKKKPK